MMDYTLLQKSRIYSSKTGCCVFDVLQRIKVTITVRIQHNLDTVRNNDRFFSVWTYICIQLH